jgi:hypothetical protein
LVFIFELFYLFGHFRMLNYEKLSGKASIFKTFTGLEVSEFDALYSKLEAVNPAFEEKRLARSGRKNKAGAGHPFKLNLKNRFLLLLTYYRLYVSSTLIGFLFDLGQTNVLKDIRALEPAAQAILPLPKKIHDATRRLQTLEEVEAYFPGFKAFIDATEQEIPRPKSKRKRKTHYSGKKKKHTVKTQITVNKDGLIIHKTRHARGGRHDYALFKQHRPCLPKKVKVGVDLGYKGINEDFPEFNAEIPFKRKSPGRGKRGIKAQELTPEEKSHNKRLAKARVVAEHTISRVKKFRIMGEEFRNRLKHYDTMTDIVSGLINFRIGGTTTV